MADQSLPKFLFDVYGWRSSKAIQRMSFAERGVYFEMLLEQWEKRNLPDSPEAVADAIAVTDAQVAEVLAAWPVVRRKFLPSRGDDQRIYNATMERTRREQREYRRKRQEAGALGGKAKSVKHSKDDDLEASNATAVLSDATAMLSDKGKERKGKERSDQESEGEKNSTGPAADGLFETFWAAYPKKKAKDDARRAWNKRKPDQALLDQMLAAIAVQSRESDWLKKDGQFIPYPATWLNAGRWTDVLEVASAGLSDTARYNMASVAEMERLLREAEATREH